MYIERSWLEKGKLGMFQPTVKFPTLPPAKHERKIEISKDWAHPCGYIAGVTSSAEHSHRPAGGQAVVNTKKSI